MTDADVDRLGTRYRQLTTDAKALRYDLEDAMDAVHRGEVDPAFGRELAAALGNLDGLSL